MTVPRVARSLFHCLLAVPLQLVVALITGSAWIGFVAVLFYFYGREKVQHEYRLKGGANTATVWHLGWWPGEWDDWSIADFMAPALVSAALAAFVHGI